MDTISARVFRVILLLLLLLLVTREAGGLTTVLGHPVGHVCVLLAAFTRVYFEAISKTFSCERPLPLLPFGLRRVLLSGGKDVTIEWIRWAGPQLRLNHGKIRELDLADHRRESVVIIKVLVVVFVPHGWCSPRYIVLQTSQLLLPLRESSSDGCRLNVHPAKSNAQRMYAWVESSLLLTLS